MSHLSHPVLFYPLTTRRCTLLRSQTRVSLGQTGLDSSAEAGCWKIGRMHWFHRSKDLVWFFEAFMWFWGRSVFVSWGDWGFRLFPIWYSLSVAWDFAGWCWGIPPICFSVEVLSLGISIDSKANYGSSIGILIGPECAVCGEVPNGLQYFGVSGATFNTLYVFGRWWFRIRRIAPIDVRSWLVSNLVETLLFLVKRRRWCVFWMFLVPEIVAFLVVLILARIPWHPSFYRIRWNRVEELVRAFWVSFSFGRCGHCQPSDYWLI